MPVRCGAAPRAVGGDVDLVVDLRWGRQRRPDYALGPRARYVRVPMAGHRDAIDTRLLERAVGHVARADGRGQTVLVHCRNGQNRTGCVFICWLVRTGVCSFDDAVARFTQLRGVGPRPGLLAWLRAYLLVRRGGVPGHEAQPDEDAGHTRVREGRLSGRGAVRREEDHSGGEDQGNFNGR